MLPFESRATTDRRLVNARNVASLLMAVAPSSVAEFKDAALEYVCLSLEAVMQNGYVECSAPRTTADSFSGL
jgi:hypothetical protein